MTIIVRIVLVVASMVIALVVLGYVGLQVRPRSFAPHPASSAQPSTVSLPSDLPPPVERFFRTAVGDRVPVIDSAVLSGRGHVKGVRLPASFRFTHQAGQGYRHYIETTVFGLPLMRVNEWYLDGHCRMELPVGVVENDAKTDMAANLGLWGESVFLPAIFLTDARVRWEPIDDTHARLVVPVGEGTDSFTVTFDSVTSLIQSMEAMRWKEPGSTSKTLWRNLPLSWNRFGGMLLPGSFAVAWGDEDQP